MDVRIEITCSCKKSVMISVGPETLDYFCESCGKLLFTAHPINGYIYILSNPSMPNLLKIGYTEREVEERVEELNSTGVPIPFEVEALFGSTNPYADEQKIHNALDVYRIAQNREFFSIDLKQAIQCATDCIGSPPYFANSEDPPQNAEQRDPHKITIETNSLDKQYIHLSPKHNWNKWMNT